MEPLSEKELSDLRRRQAPEAPASLEEKVFPPAVRLPWWRWLLQGSVRVPVPAFAAVLALLLLIYSIVSTPKGGPAASRRDAGRVSTSQATATSNSQEHL